MDLGALDLRTYIAEPNRGRRNWKKKTVARDAVYANRRRIRGARGLGFAAAAERTSRTAERTSLRNGGLRRTHVRGHANILKRLLIQTSAFNLGLLMRTLIGVGTRAASRGAWRRSGHSSSPCGHTLSTSGVTITHHPAITRPQAHRIIVSNYFQSARRMGPLTTGC